LGYGSASRLFTVFEAQRAKAAAPKLRLQRRRANVDQCITSTFSKVKRANITMWV